MTRKHQIEKVALFGREFFIVNISEVGVLIEIEDTAFIDTYKDSIFTISLLLNNGSCYEVFATCNRVDGTFAAIEFSEKIPVSLISDRASFRLQYLTFYRESPCYLETDNNRFTVIEISQPNVVVIANDGTLAVGDGISGTVHLLFDGVHSWKGTVFKTYDNRVVIKLDETISSLINMQEIGLYRRFPEKYKELRAIIDKKNAKIKKGNK